MKLSVKAQDQPHQDHNHRTTTTTTTSSPFLVRAKLPITIFNLPFLSAVSTTDPSDLSFSLRTNFPSGPTLKLSYTPTTPTPSSATSPLSLTLKSGVSLFGSPTNSPLLISAHFTLSPHNPNNHPTFSLQIKPQFGDFSLRKTTHSQNPNPSSNSKPPDAEVNSMGFVPLERPSATWNDVSLVDNSLSGKGDASLVDNSLSGKGSSLLSGIAVAARTRLPVTSRVAVSCRWGVNFPADIRKRMPFLTVRKVSIERVDEAKEVEGGEVRSGNVADMEILKGLCLSVGRELEVLQRENREMKQSLEEMMRVGKLGGPQAWSQGGYFDGSRKKVPVGNGGSGGFDQWKNKKGGEEDHGLKESKKNGNQASNMEIELQRAIKAASS